MFECGTRDLVVSGSECQAVINKSMAYRRTLLIDIITGKRDLVVWGISIKLSSSRPRLSREHY